MTQNKLFWNLLIGLGGLAMFLLASFFALERIISADTADYLVHLINTQKFYFGSQRFIAASTQILPILLIKLHAPFKVVLHGYNGSLILFHVGCLLAILLYCKDQKVALVLLLAHLLGGSLLFYYPVSEYQMGLSLSLFFYAFLKNKIILERLNWQKGILAAFILATVLYSHPLTILFVVFLFVYAFIQNQKWWSNKRIGGVVIFVLIVFASKYALFSIANDTDNISLLTHLKIFPIVPFRVFWNELLTYHYLFILFFIANVVVLIYRKKYVVTSLFLFYLYLNLYLCLLKLGTDGFNWYAAHIFQSVFYIAIFLFVEEWSKVFLQAKLTKVLVLGLVVFSLVQTFERHSFNTNRIGLIQEYMDAANGQDIKKGLIDHQHAYNTKKNWLWAMEYESLIISTYKQNSPTTVVYKLEDVLAPELKESSTAFITVWGSFPQKDLNAFYFPLPEVPYQFVVLP